MRQQAADFLRRLSSTGMVVRPAPEQPFQRRAECPAAFSFAGPGDEDRAIGPIDDAPGQIAHDIMA